MLRLLSDGSPFSIGALSSASGLAPEHVRTVCDQLLDLGVDLRRDGSDGSIRLSAPCQMLDAARIAALVQADGSSRPAVHFVEQCLSTNDELRELARGGASNGTGLTCEVQTGGRGRRGRRWIAPPGASVALSVLWRFAGNVQALTGLPLAAAVASVRALERCGAHGLAIKWPNDLLCNGAKVGGILIDTTSGDEGCVAIIGVGVNVAMSDTARTLIDSLGGTERALAPAALQRAPGALLDRNAVIAAMVDEICRACELFAQEGLEPFRAPWLALHALHQAEVTIGSGTGPLVTGRAVDVASDGALIVDTAHGWRRFYAGDVSLRA